jgi:hypothetical protein
MLAIGTLRRDNIISLAVIMIHEKNDKKVSWNQLLSHKQTMVSLLTRVGQE